MHPRLVRAAAAPSAPATPAAARTTPRAGRYARSNRGTADLRRTAGPANGKSPIPGCAPACGRPRSPGPPAPASRRRESTRTSSGSPNVEPTEDRRALRRCRTRPPDRPSSARSSGWISAGTPVRPADRDHREHVVEVAVGEQDGGRLQLVAPQHRVDRVLDPDPGVDDRRTPRRRRARRRSNSSRTLGRRCGGPARHRGYRDTICAHGPTVRVRTPLRGYHSAAVPSLPPRKQTRPCQGGPP